MLPIGPTPRRGAQLHFGHILRPPSQQRGPCVWGAFSRDFVTFWYLGTSMNGAVHHIVRGILGARQIFLLHYPRNTVPAVHHQPSDVFHNGTAARIASPCTDNNRTIFRFLLGCHPLGCQHVLGTARPLVTHHASQTSPFLEIPGRVKGYMASDYPNFKPWVGSHRPSWGGPLTGRAFPDAVGTPPNLIPTSGVHMPVCGPTLALVGVGAARGSSACASTPYCGFWASACRCCCSELELAC